MTTYIATYSPDDNKLRLSASNRLDAATYERVKAVGFKWAPKQDIFIAPMWTPEREDLCIELAGEIEDDDRSLIERAEERADRFGDYSEKRGKEAASARAYVQSITEHIPLGQPILVGHHSERHARKAARRIENGMRRAVQLWETSAYWSQRAARAVEHAKYKERPDVRHRRIKGLEADKRKQEKNIEEAEKALGFWLQCEAQQDPAKKMAMALQISGFFGHAMPRKEGDRTDWNQLPSAYSVLNNSHPALYAPRTVEEVIEEAKKQFPASTARFRRWLNHYENRIAYERAMLGEDGVVKGEKFDLQIGGRVLIGSEWLVVLRINKREGRILSVRTNARYVPVRGIEEVQDYTPPTEEDANKAKEATALGPVVNYPTEGCIEMTKAEFETVPKNYRGTDKIKAAAEFGAHRIRSVLGCFASRTGNERHFYHKVFITDAKRVAPPKKQEIGQEDAPVTFERKLEIPQAKTVATDAQINTLEKQAKQAEAEQIAAMRETLKSGVRVVTAPQLFPTPAPLAAEIVEMAGIEAGMTVLEPSAGTGNLLQAIREATAGEAVRTAIEINTKLCEQLKTQEPGADIHQADFLALTPETFGRFDRVVMNPPFANAEDIKHIEHALKFLKAGGKLVAICAGGPRQAERLDALARQMGGTFENLPEGSFVASGTNVRAAVFAVTAP